MPELVPLVRSFSIGIQNLELSASAVWGTPAWVALALLLSVGRHPLLAWHFLEKLDRLGFDVQLAHTEHGP